MYEILRPTLNAQADSIRAKLFYMPTFLLARLHLTEYTAVSTKVVPQKR